MSKFEINRITIELIRAILRFRFSFPPLTMYKNNFQILFQIQHNHKSNAEFIQEGLKTYRK
jgi:hypothetical protein